KLFLHQRDYDVASAKGERTQHESRPEERPEVEFTLFSHITSLKSSVVCGIKRPLLQRSFYYKIILPRFSDPNGELGGQVAAGDDESCAALTDAGDKTGLVDGEHALVGTRPGDREVRVERISRCGELQRRAYDVGKAGRRV